MPPRRTLAWFAALALAAGLSGPYVELAWKCRSGREATEACVWAKAYLPLTRMLIPALVSPIVFVTLLLGSLAFMQRRSR